MKQKTIQNKKFQEHGLDEDKLKAIEDAIAESSVTKKMVAREAGVSYHTVHHFFSGKFYNRAVHKAAIELPKRMNELKMKSAMDTIDRIDCLPKAAEL